MKPVVVKAFYFSAAVGVAYGGYKFGTKLRDDTDKRRAMFADPSPSNTSTNLDEDIEKIREEIRVLEQERLKIQLAQKKENAT
ncbi:hypothetical protein BDF20DRAFT_845257 [Mycotypha africana]|uniref:uncharacterized protein n=1 Tax=Mycotypha africana TaxID=64632 RepID=UPI002301E9D1|nr:uncharacterized protein BDF20DRAFT_845257 [Mycotypha africana]KAI8991554.1 hypothetical protein BDF20DRAFT_845257 [Mycotypha africana]